MNLTTLLATYQHWLVPVDLVEPEKVLAAEQEEGVKLSTLLTTHLHWLVCVGQEEPE